MNKKSKQLKMSISMASHKLKKNILFELVKKCGLDTCFQCKQKIETAIELSVEHKIPWLDSDNPIELFFSIDNIAFSHFKCNSLAARPRKRQHPSITSYETGCRCKECKKHNSERVVRWRNRKKLASLAPN